MFPLRVFHLRSRGAGGLSADGGFTEYLRYSLHDFCGLIDSPALLTKPTAPKNSGLAKSKILVNE